MQALVTEIWLFLVGAALIGAGMAWVLGRFRTRSLIDRLAQTWQTRLRTSDDSWNSKLRVAEQSFSSQLDQKSAQISALTTDCESERGRRLAMADELAKWKADVAEMLEERDIVHEKLRRMDERLAVALEDADQLDLEVKRLSELVSELEHEAESYRLRAHLLQPLEDQVKQLEASIEARDARIRDLSSLQDELDQREAMIERLRAEHRIALERRAEEATRLRTRIGELEPVVTRLEAEVEELRRRKSTNGQPDLKIPTEPIALARDATPPAIEKRDLTIGGQDLRGGRDDLKRIAGVGPVLERTLNRMGVLTYRQIAQWNESEIDRMSDRLDGFHDRIRRDDWVGQARRLHREAHGEPL